MGSNGRAAVSTNKEQIAMKTPIPRALCAALWLAATTAQAVDCKPDFPASNPDSAYIVHSDGTVTDTRTGLMWKQCLEGQDAQNNCAGTPTLMTWAQALALAGSSFAAYSDWRMPNVKELHSLVEECRVEPAINNTIFKNVPADFPAWTGSPAGADITWAIAFGQGTVLPFQPQAADGLGVRLVRGPLAAALPVLSDVALSAMPTASGATIAGTSSLAATGYWLVVPRDSAAPTPAQVKAQATYGNVTPVAKGSVAMQANTPASFAITGLAPFTGYDFYLMADASGSLSAAVQKVKFATAAAPADGACGSAHNPGSTPLLTEAPAASLCGAGTASTVTGNTIAWNWSCTGGNVSTSCQAPRGYTVATSAGPNGSIGAAQTVAYNGTASITVTPATGYAVDTVTGCGGILAGSTFTTAQVTADCSVSATFKAAPAVLTVPEGPQMGQPITLTPPSANGWQVTQASTQTTASVGAALPPGVTLPHGVVNLRLELGTAGSTAQVVLTYPEALPAGAVYYKYGPVVKNGPSRWYPFQGARISGNTVTLTLKDGAVGDDDLTENSVINDPGGVALLAAPAGAQAIPTLGEWALALLAGALGLFSLGALRRRGA